MTRGRLRRVCFTTMTSFQDSRLATQQVGQGGKVCTATDKLFFCNVATTVSIKDIISLFSSAGTVYVCC